MSTASIRFANTHDAHGIARVHVASWQSIYRGLLPDNDLDALSIAARGNEWRELLNQGIKILVIEQDGLVVGFASIGLSRDESANAHCGEISAIYLHPHFWRQGLGKQLCAAALMELKNMGFFEVVLWVVEANQRARKFYESMGFTGTGNAKFDIFIKDISLREVQYIIKFQVSSLVLENK